MSNVIRRLAGAISNQTPGVPPPGLRLRQGVVTAVGTSPSTATVRVGKATTAVPGVRCAVYYAPVVGDVVHLLQNGTDLLCLGPVATAPSRVKLTATTSRASSGASTVVAGGVSSVLLSTTLTLTSDALVWVFAEFKLRYPANSIAGTTRLLFDGVELDSQYFHTQTPGSDGRATVTVSGMANGITGSRLVQLIFANDVGAAASFTCDDPQLVTNVIAGSITA